MLAGLVLIGVRTRRRWILRGSQVLAGLFLIQAAVLSYWQWVVQGKTMAVGQLTLFVITLWLGPILWMWYSTRLAKMMKSAYK